MCHVVLCCLCYVMLCCSVVLPVPSNASYLVVLALTVSWEVKGMADNGGEWGEDVWAWMRKVAGGLEWMVRHGNAMREDKCHFYVTGYVIWVMYMSSVNLVVRIFIIKWTILSSTCPRTRCTTKWWRKWSHLKYDHFDSMGCCRSASMGSKMVYIGVGIGWDIGWEWIGNMKRWRQRDRVSQKSGGIYDCVDRLKNGLHWLRMDW